ncbi:hypothetical protein BOS5A_200461 [Bosea sp. EC-HK365B]|nr:hypothetical protein BOS5A_200461 [Bosea sp. EC-HK365B]
MFERGGALAVGKVAARTGADQCPHRLDMARPAIAEDHRLDQGGPAEIVDMVERRAGRDQFAHHAVMAEMGGRDQSRAEIGAGDGARVAADGERSAHGLDIIRDRRDGDRVIGAAVEGTRISTCPGELAHRLALAGMGGGKQCGTALTVAGFEAMAGRDRLPEGYKIAAIGRQMQPVIGRHLGRRWRNLSAGSPAHAHCHSDEQC